MLQRSAPTAVDSFVVYWIGLWLLGRLRVFQADGRGFESNFPICYQCTAGMIEGA